MKFGTKGFLSAMIAMQIAAVPHLFADNVTTAKKSKGTLKKVGGKVTGQENLVDDAKEEAKNTAEDAAESQVDEAVSPLKDASKGKLFN